MNAKNKDGSDFPPYKVENPPIQNRGFIAGHCVICGGSLGGPYMEDLFHMECIDKSEIKN